MEKNERTRAKTKILLESLVVFFVAISPFLYKLYEYLPLSSDGTVSIIGFIIKPNGFPDAQTYLWFLTSKVVPLYLFLIWFLTSRDWWYHIILIPISMYSFQLFEVIYDTDKVIDTKNILWLLPICMVVIPFVYFIRIKLYDKHVNGIDLEAMDAELKALKNKSAARETNSINNDTSRTQDNLASTSKVTTKRLEQSIQQFKNQLNNLFKTDS